MRNCTKLRVTMPNQEFTVQNQEVILPYHKVVLPNQELQQNQEVTIYHIKSYYTKIKLLLNK